MSKQTREGRLADTKITLPLTQTVFLPKTAVGVRYIDKIRATVFIDDLQRSGDTVWLRGFYELDMEYQGMEGRGLNKYRIMLPLKVQTPPGWLGGLAYEAADLHGAVARPMVKILSPYVLDFSGTLNLEYVGDYRWQEDKTAAAASAPSAEAVHTLSPRRRVWTSDIPMPDADAVDKRIESKIDRFFLGAASDKQGEPRLIRSTDEQAEPQPVRAAAEPSEPPLIRVTGEKPLRPQVKVTQFVNVPVEVMPEAKQEPEEQSRIPVWHFPEPDLRPVNTVENPVEKPVGIPVYNPVNNAVENAAVPEAAERTANMEQIYAPKLNKNRFRTLLTTAALAKLKARGESLQAAAQAEAAAAVAEAGEPVKPIETVKVTETAAVTEEVETLAEQNDVQETVVEKTAAPAADAVSAVVETVENKEGEVENPVENAAEAVAAEPSVAEPAAAEASSLETEASAEEVVDVAAETAEETAEETAAVMAEAALEASAPVEPAAPDVELKLVNANGVRLKMSAAQPARAAQAPAPAEGAKKAGAFSMRFYVVKPGDQPMSIALKNNISLESLLAANRITEGELKAGTVLRIPG